MPSSLFSTLIKNYDSLKYDLLEAHQFNPDHYGFDQICYDIMTNDRQRVDAFRKAFQQCDFQDKVICEAGIGNLALTKHYLPKVKKAYLIEYNPNLRKFIESEISKNGWTHKVELIWGDAMTVQLPEKVDFIVGELMSIFCANEYQVQIFKHLRQFLKPDGKLLPEKIINIIQLANTAFDQNQRHYPINFSRHLPINLSLQQVFNTIDLYTVEEELVQQKIPITPILSGEANAVYMHSFIEIVKGCNFTGSDSLMPPTICALDKSVMVQAHEQIELSSEFTYGTSLDEARFWI
ncbi:MAG: methyltransferase domain-containing protein [Saprospiraceae bacterium]